MAILALDPIAVDAADGAVFELHVEAVTSDIRDCSRGDSVVRPIPLARFDERSLELAVNFGVGMSSSGLIALLDEDAVGDFLLHDDELDLTGYRETYISRTWGTGMSSSGRIALYDQQSFTQLELGLQAVVLRTFGNGMSSSGLIFDEALFNSDRFADYTPSITYSVGRMGGVGMSSSGLIRDDGTFTSLSDYVGLRNFEPAIVWVSHGVGMSSSGLIFDRGVLSDTMDRVDTAARDGYVTIDDDIGLAESMMVFDLDPEAASEFGTEWETLPEWITEGVGMSSSGLVVDRWNLYTPVGYEGFALGGESLLGGRGDGDATLVGLSDGTTATEAVGLTSQPLD